MNMPFPHVIRIELASSCNLACRHCPTGICEMERGILEEVVWRKVIQELHRYKDIIKVIVFYHGGEPLLNKNVFDYAKTVREVNIDIHIKTVSNGMALGKPNIEKLIGSEFNSIEFSLDGLSKKENEFIRRKSNVERVIKNIQLLIQMKKEMHSDLEILIATTQFITDKPHLNPLPPEWLMDVFANDVKYKVNYAIKWPGISFSDDFEYVTFPGEDKNTCDHLDSTITIRSDGNVVPCCYDLTSQLVMGNKDNTLQEIYYNSQYEELKRSITTKNYKSICADCATVRPTIYLKPKWTRIK